MNGHTHRDSSAPNGKDKQAIDYEVLSYLIQLYGSTQGQRLHDQLRGMARQTAGKLASKRRESPPSEALLICYGDSLRQDDTPPLKVLKDFSDNYLKGVVTGIHVLPFFLRRPMTGSPWSITVEFARTWVTGLIFRRWPKTLM